jgi:hypothetical protein
MCAAEQEFSAHLVQWPCVRKLLAQNRYHIVARERECGSGESSLLFIAKSAPRIGQRCGVHGARRVLFHHTPPKVKQEYNTPTAQIYVYAICRMYLPRKKLAHHRQ